MPYIQKHRRVEIDAGALPETAGELNYRLTKLIIDDGGSGYGYLSNYRKQVREMFDLYVATKGKSYQTFNDIMGAVFGALIEHHRRTEKFGAFSILDAMKDYYWEVIGPYEDTKIKENGDVY